MRFGCLIFALGTTIDSFTRQIDKAAHVLSVKDLGTPPQPPLVTTNSASTKATAATGVAKHGEGVKDNKVEPQTALVETPLKVDLSSMGSSIVAVVTVLVIAISAVSIVLLRATYSLSVSGPDGKTAAMPASDISDNGIPFPGAEVIKAIGEAMSTVIKGMPSKKD